MEQPTLFRKESIERIQSPEQLNDYMRVTNPAIWVVLAAVILLLAGMLIWGASARIDSVASGTAQVENGALLLSFDDARQADKVQPGMEIVIGESRTAVASVGRAEDGSLFAVAQTDLSDGSYPARVVYRSTQVLQLLFN